MVGFKIIEKKTMLTESPYIQNAYVFQLVLYFFVLFFRGNVGSKIIPSIRFFPVTMSRCKVTLTSRFVLLAGLLGILHNERKKNHTTL